MQSTSLRRIPFAGWAALLGVVVVGLVVLAALRPSGPGERLPSLGNTHIVSINAPHLPYNSVPPTSGPHVGGKAPWGISDAQIPDELQLHNLEDGGVIIHYDAARVDESVRASLVKIVDGYRDRVILEPYAGLTSPIVLTAWQRRMALETADEAAIQDFIRAYRGRDHHAPGL